MRAKAPGTIDTAALSQWQLIRLRFARHRLAMFSLFLLLNIYFLALFAEFYAPLNPNERHEDYSYAPPMMPRFSFGKGFYVHPVQNVIEPVNLKNSYLIDRDRYLPLSFFVPVEERRLWGLFPIRHALFGIDVGNPVIEEQGIGPAARFWFLFGTDQYGQDVWSRLIYGSRISLSIGLVGISFTFVIGIILGGISGYVGGWVDTLIQRLIEIVAAFPQLPLWLVIAAILPPWWSALSVYFAITVLLSLLGWTGLARVTRGKILSLREEEYAVAARLLGASHGRILFRHLVPGFTSHIIVTLTLSVPGMILGETALSFLGLGLRPPIVSWGVMLQDCFNLDVVANYPWLLLPVVMIVLTVLSFNFLGDGLRDASDPYSR